MGSRVAKRQMRGKFSFGNTGLSEPVTNVIKLTLNQIQVLLTEVKSSHINVEKEKLLNLLVASISQKQDISFLFIKRK